MDKQITLNISDVRFAATLSQEKIVEILRQWINQKDGLILVKGIEIDERAKDEPINLEGTISPKGQELVYQRGTCVGIPKECLLTCPLSHD